MIRRGLLLKLFDAAYMTRWNDKPRPMDFFELDKQAHKMVYAYFLGFFEQDRDDFSWIDIIEGGIFEFLHRLVLTDLKPSVYYPIVKDEDKRRQINEYVYEKLKPYLCAVGEGFKQRYKAYFESAESTIAKRVLAAAHFLSSEWEFQMIGKICPDWYSIDDPRKDFARRRQEASCLKGIGLMDSHPEYRDFLTLCGQLRFQIRWAPLHRTPRTSVLGHSLYVAMVTYLLSLDFDACPVRRFNNYFTGLFHDLPEALTRDIVSPIKRSVEGLSELIKGLERKQMDTFVYPLLPEKMGEQIKMFTDNEFKNCADIDGLKNVGVDSNVLCSKYNQDEFNPRDGELVKAVDELAAFIEASVAIENGCLSGEFQKAKWMCRNEYERKVICGISFGQIYADFT